MASGLWSTTWHGSAERKLKGVSPRACFLNLQLCWITVSCGAVMTGKVEQSSLCKAPLAAGCGDKGNMATVQTLSQGCKVPFRYGDSVLHLPRRLLG